MDKNLLQTIVDALPHPALVLDFDFKIQTANSAAISLFDTELQGMDFVRVLRQPEAIDCLGKVVNTGKLKTCDFVLH